MSAATDWLKYDRLSGLGPQEYEWCLWSMEINDKRNYFTGYIYDKKIHWDGRGEYH